MYRRTYWLHPISKSVSPSPPPEHSAPYRATHEPGRHGGAVGHAALQVLHALIFDFLNHRTGRLDPSYAAIARKAGVCVRTVASALQRLQELGILDWVRRCAETWRDGRFVLEQETNAYGLQPESQWRGYRAPQKTPEAPWPTLGATPPLPSALAQAALEGGLAGKVHVAWLVTPRTAWRPPCRGWGGRSWPATREFPRSAADAEKHSRELIHTCNSRLRPVDRSKEDALNKRRRGNLCLSRLTTKPRHRRYWRSEDAPDESKCTLTGQRSSSLSPAPAS